MKKEAKPRGKKVLVGLSGGVDSSVTACLLKQQGYDVTGVHLHLWPGDAGKKCRERKSCCSSQALDKVISVAARIGIPLLVIDSTKPFKKKVVRHFVRRSRIGLTPNPCVECNREIKFGLFLEKMKELGADYVATGHYARIIRNGHSRPVLFAAADKFKDQSYFLYTLTADKLRKILFPLGGVKKSHVRRLALKFGLDDINSQPESQNLCFISDGDTSSFLRRQMKGGGYGAGPIVTRAGLEIGRHEGLPFYTIGQRKNLRIGGLPGVHNGKHEPWYVAGADRKKNALIAGREEELYSSELVAEDLTFVDGRIPLKATAVKARIRYRAPAEDATLEIVRRGKNRGPVARVVFRKKQRAVTPGQSVVFYKGKQVLGGGIIAR